MLGGDALSHELCRRDLRRYVPGCLLVGAPRHEPQTGQERRATGVSHLSISKQLSTAVLLPLLSTMMSSHFISSSARLVKSTGNSNLVLPRGRLTESTGS